MNMRVYSLRTASEDLRPGEYGDLVIKRVLFEDEHLDSDLPHKRFRRESRDFFRYRYHAFNGEEYAFLQTLLFSAQAFHDLRDLLVQPFNQIYTYLVYDLPTFYCVYPPAVDCGEPYPDYRRIAECLPPNLHYFRKFENSDFLCVTDTFFQRVKAQKLKGFGFEMKWNGSKIVPDKGATAY